VTAAIAAAVHVQVPSQAQQQPTSHWQAAAQSLRRSLDDSNNRRSLDVSRSPSNGSTSAAAAAAAVTSSVSHPSSSKSSSKSPTRRAELSRKQLKAVRKLFPITTPSLKPAAVLQVRNSCELTVSKSAQQAPRQHFYCVDQGKQVCIWQSLWHLPAQCAFQLPIAAVH
jgi:hypothetical protein